MLFGFSQLSEVVLNVVWNTFHGAALSRDIDLLVHASNTYYMLPSAQVNLVNRLEVVANIVL